MRAGAWRRAVCAVVVGGVLVGGVLATVPQSARAADPTWAEVQAAKKNVTAKAAEVRRIESALSDLEDEAARLGTLALQKAEASTAAQGRLDAARTTVARLDAQVGDARRRATAARREAGAVATQLVRGGDPALGVWLAGDRSDSLLYRLGALAQIGDSSSSLLSTAVVEQRDADALGRQAAAQAAVRDDLAKAATAAAASAKAAEQAAEAQVSATQARRATLQAQLKDLQATSSSLQASYAAAQAAKRAAAAAGDGGGGTGSLSGLGGGPGSLSPAAAQAYAASRLGAYGWGGGQMGCLARLWTIESGWRWNAYNASSGAYGIPQSLPGSKMSTAGGDWTTSSRTQIEWGLGYIQARYGDPCGALAFETSHVPYWY